MNTYRQGWFSYKGVVRVSAMDDSFGNPKIALWLSDECDKLAEVGKSRDLRKHERKVVAANGIDRTTVIDAS